MLKYLVANQEALPGSKVRTMLQQALDDIGFSTSTTTVSSLEVLISSLQRDQCEVETSLFQFLDECLVRLAKKPVKYYDDLTAIVNEIESNDVEIKTGSIGLFLTVILEQWPFLVKSASSHDLRIITEWLNSYLVFGTQVGENTTVLSYFRKQIQKLVIDIKARSMLETPSEKPQQLTMIKLSTISDVTDQRKVKNTTLASQPGTTETRIFLESCPPVEVHDERDLTRWSKKDMGQAMLDGDVGALVLCLCSKYEEVRKHALNSLRIILGKLEVCLSLFKHEQGL